MKVRELSSLIIIYIYRIFKRIPNNPIIVAIKAHQYIGIFSSRFYSPEEVSASKGRRSMSTSSKPVPVRVYLNPDKEKELIVNENKGRTGIYRWVHIESGKSYIGSAKNLSSRFKQYFNYNHISYPTRNMIIYKALLKYGYAGFRLEILEYCSLELLLDREQFYFDMFSPDYNILKVAGSPLGYRHSEAAKKLISIWAKNREVSEFTRDLKIKALLGKSLDKEHIEKMRLGNILRKSVVVTNTETGENLEFASRTEAGKYLGLSRNTVKRYLLKNTPYKKYIITANCPSLADKENTEVSSSSSALQTKISQQPVLLTNKETGDIKEFSSITEAAKYLDISKARVWYYFSKTVKTGNETLKGYTITKIDNFQKKVHRKTKGVEVTDLYTKEVTIYSSIALTGGSFRCSFVKPI